MEIRPAGSFTPLSETSAESVTPHDAQHAQGVHEHPFHDDKIVSYSPPGLDLGLSSTIPVQDQTVRDPQDNDPNAIGGSRQLQKELDNILTYEKEKAKGLINKIR